MAFFRVSGKIAATLAEDTMLILSVALGVGYEAPAQDFCPGFFISDFPRRSEKW